MKLARPSAVLLMEKQRDLRNTLTPPVRTLLLALIQVEC